MYGCVFVHSDLLIYGGYYTYAATPLGNWAKDAFGLARNHYDRVGHLALGVFPSFAIREDRSATPRFSAAGWLYFLILSVVLAIAAFWELLEWWVTLVVAGDVGTAFLGSQGDPWDAQWDMFLALVGAAIVLPVFGGAHDSLHGSGSHFPEPRAGNDRTHRPTSEPEETKLEACAKHSPR